METGLRRIRLEFLRPGDSWRDGHHDLRGGAAQRPATHAGRETGYIHRRLPEKAIRPALGPLTLRQPDGDGFDYHRQENTNRSYQNRYEEFRNWRQKVLEAARRKNEAARPEEEKLEKAWQTLKRDIKSSADTIHGIDTGQCRGYNRALFVSSILNKVSTFANHGEVEIVRRAVDFISEYNARVRKPVITPRNKFFQLPELAERMRERLKAVQSRENKEVPFEGGTLVWNYGEDRLQILFDRIPEDNRRKKLKSSGFRWSPRNKAWQRQLTSNALSAAKRVLNLQNI